MFTVDEPDFKLEGGKTTFTVKAHQKENEPAAQADEASAPQTDEQSN